ncbi:MAG: tetratricopeptide repeat protein [Gemmataceae bacterium]
MRASEINVRFLVGTGVLVAAAAGLLAVVHHRQMSRHARDQLARADQAEADNQPAEVVRSLARALSFDPGNQDLRDRYALTLAEQARTPAERWKALQVLGQLPHDAAARLKAVELALDLGEPEEAMRHLKPALEADPDNPDLLALLARCQEAIGRPANAAESLRKALTARPTDVELITRLADLYRRLDQTKQADALMERLVRDNPRSPSVRIAAARYHSSAGRLDRAVRELDEARRLAPTDVAVLQASAQLAEQQGEVKQAVEWRRQLVQRQPDRPDAHVQLAQAEREAGQPGQAIAALRDGLKRIPDDADLLFELGFLLLEQGDIAKAKAVRERLPATSRGKALGLAGRAAASAGDWYQAARDYSAALDLADLTRGQQSRLLLGLAECYDRLGGREEQRLRGWARRSSWTRRPRRGSTGAALVRAGAGCDGGRSCVRSPAGRRRWQAIPHSAGPCGARRESSSRRGPGGRTSGWPAPGVARPSARQPPSSSRSARSAASCTYRDLLDRAHHRSSRSRHWSWKRSTWRLRQDDEAAARTLAERGDARFGAKVDWLLGRAVPRPAGPA